MINLTHSVSFFKRTLIAMLIFTVFLAACSRTANPLAPLLGRDVEKEFQSQIEADSLNKQLELELIESPGESLGNSDITQFLIKNTSEQDIVFSADYSVRIFALDNNNEWLRIQNSIEYLGTRETLEPNNGPASNWFTVLSVSPELSNLPPETLVRVYVAGNISTSGNETGSTAGAYIDLSRSAFR